MDYGRLIIFVFIALYCFYSFLKTRLNFYLILAALSWFIAIYSGKLNVYQTLGEPAKSVVRYITTVVLFIMFLPYLRQSLREYKKYKNGN